MTSVIPQRTGSARALAAVGVFLIFGACMAGIAGTTLLWPGTPLDKMWSLNGPAYQQLAPLGAKVGVPFLILSAALIATARGWFQRRLWGWRLTVAIIAIQVAGDLINLVRGDYLRGGTGVLIAALLLFYLLRPHVRMVFE